MALTTLRRNLLTRPLFGWARRALPGLSDTEREALAAGEVWWDAELFSGNPDWEKLRNTAPATLTDEEKAFLDGPVQDLCAMVDDWQVSWELHDLPEDVWDFMKKKKFFGMIIPKSHGGLGFSAYAHSEVVRTIASRSLTAAVTVMVPNSLGPGELLMQFGTDKQKKHWLPRLADGREIPCFGLTSPEAGSDAAAMRDTGIVCKGEWNGKKDVLGIRLNWHKRYITLGPVATVLGLAFKMRDPDGLLGGKEDLGITVALVPTDLPGIDIGKRHIANMQMFQNGPNWGRDVFVPLDSIIGGPDYVGKGWEMLMSALAAGRGISLPSLGASATALAARTSGSYARIREQFDIPIGKFEGIRSRLAELAGTAYLVDAARKLTCAGLDEGRALAVISGIMKAHGTCRMREAVNDAMDVHAGKAVIDGPLNYLGNAYRAVPIGITVEGANILTRNMIIFGQGAIRCHPHLLDEMLALEKEDKAEALKAFDKAFWGHVGHSFKTLFRAWGRAWTGAAFAPAPDEPKALRPYYKQLSRYAAGFALAADMALLTLGGGLKRKELLSARFGDILSELYLLSAVLKRWQDDGAPEEDLPIVEYCIREGFLTIENRFMAIFRNLPSRPVAWFLKGIILPFGVRAREPSDALVNKCADALLKPGATRDRLTEGIFRGTGDDGMARLECAFDLVVETEGISKRLRDADIAGWREGLERGLITEEEAGKMKARDEAVSKAVEVDHFDADELAPRTRHDKDTGGKETNGKTKDTGGSPSQRETKTKAAVSG